MKAGWESTILGNVIDLQSGFAFKSAEFTEDGHFLMRIANVQDGDISLEKPKFVQLTKQTKRFELEEGDILTSLTGNVGRVAEIKASHLPAALNQRVARIKPKEDIDVDRSYLRHFLSSDAFSSFLQQEAHGAAQANVSPNAIKEVPFALPPLEEQKRIVSILDEAFEGLDRARENAEANLKNAQELFEVFTKTVFGRSGKGWMQCTIGDVITLQRGIDITKKDQRAGRVPVVSSGGVKSYHDTAHTEGPGVIVGRKGSIGSVHFIDEAYWPHDTTLWVRDFKGNEPELVYFLLIGIRLAELDTGTANPSLNRNLVHTVPISWPSVHLQPAIVKELADCRDASKTAQLQYTAKLQDISDLRQSLLQKAFAGELT